MFKGEMIMVSSDEYKTPYNPILLSQYQPNLQKLRKYNNLRIPTQIFIKKDGIAAFVWDEVIYLIAPKING